MLTKYKILEKCSNFIKNTKYKYDMYFKKKNQVKIEKVSSYEGLKGN